MLILDFLGFKCGILGCQNLKISIFWYYFS